MKLPLFASAPVESVVDWIAGQVKQLVPEADMDNRDPEFIARVLGPSWQLARLYFRPEVRGLDRIPASGPVLLVGNHSGGNTSPEVLVTALAFARHFGPRRPFYQLAHNLVMLVPVLGPVLGKWGTIAATPDSARAALRSGAVVLVYPGGDWEVHRPAWEGDRIDFAGRTGFLRLAWQERVPIVPMVNYGAHQNHLILTRGDRLARLLRLDRMLRLKVFPISLAAPWGLNISDLAGHLPLPTKVTIEFLEPIDLRAELGPELDLSRAYEYITGLMQRTLSRLADEADLPIIG
ncbi:1-acyl-sn-glycerol-3-phosphate acyltransferase [Nocardia pseudobrasiliensis]|uniref:1-acyl-sn-glycerol-3-phosphate acyltransferase n=1 Tax=Nocardia pseudobrasiliensis TaxID=45979 RepID=A0A370ICS2_9NOCA|nr:1-acyl-sn-glycerol-3-phosphate acyltransferase [Nocardia pseudobrasiliensis]RDI67891.1 1-acyl-sn-glycerol-3-phosphate acyltransferase [Nocardia pseudobrasiliensis]